MAILAWPTTTNRPNWSYFIVAENELFSRMTPILIEILKIDSHFRHSFDGLGIPEYTTSSELKWKERDVAREKWF